MAKPRIYKTEAIVLKKFNIGEADSIVTLLTPNLGKLRAVVKGVRRPKSKLGGHLDLLTQSSLLLAHGQNLDIVTQGQTIESFNNVKTDLQCIGYAIYMADLVDQFMVEGSENYNVYRLLQDGLCLLSKARNKEVFLRYFELSLLNYLGYKPELRYCTCCRMPLVQTRNFFSINNGGVICPGCATSEQSLWPVSVDLLKVLRFISEKDYSVVNRLKVDENLAGELEDLLRSYIRYHLEKDVKSAEFVNHIKRIGCTTRHVANGNYI